MKSLSGGRGSPILRLYWILGTINRNATTTGVTEGRAPEGKTTGRKEVATMTAGRTTEKDSATDLTDSFLITIWIDLFMFATNLDINKSM